MYILQVFVDGDWVGTVPNGYELARALRQDRRSQDLDAQVRVSNIYAFSIKRIARMRAPVLSDVERRGFGHDFRRCTLKHQLSLISAPRKCA